MIPTKSCKIPKDSKPYSAIKIKDIDIITQVLALSLREPLFFIFLHTHTEREREREGERERENTHLVSQSKPSPAFVHSMTWQGQTASSVFSSECIQNPQNRLQGNPIPSLKLKEKISSSLINITRTAFLD